MLCNAHLKYIVLHLIILFIHNCFDYSEKLIGISTRGRDLLKKLLDVDPVKRYTASEALKHPWFKMLPLYDKASSFPLPLPSSFTSLSQTRNVPVEKYFVPVKSILILNQISEVEVDATSPCTTMLVSSDGSVARNSTSECNFSDIECYDKSASNIVDGHSFLNANMINDSLKIQIIRHNPMRVSTIQENKIGASQSNNQLLYIPKKKNNKSFMSYLRKMFRNDVKGI